MKKFAVVCWFLCLSLCCTACRSISFVPGGGTETPFPADSQAAAQTPAASCEEASGVPHPETGSETEPEPICVPASLSRAEWMRIPYRDGGTLSRLGGEPLASGPAYLPVFCLPVRSEKHLSRLMSEMEVYAEETGYRFDAQPWRTAASLLKKNQKVFLLEITAPSGSIRYRLKEVTALPERDGLDVTFQRLVPAVGTDDMASWLVFLCVDKAYSSTDRINVTFEEAAFGGSSCSAEG